MKSIRYLLSISIILLFYSFSLSAQDPVANCMNITVSLDSDGDYNLDPSEVDDGSTAFHEIESLSVDPSFFNCFDLGPNDVTLTVTDTLGQTSDCMAVVTVEDNTEPDAVCQDITVSLGANGSVTINANQIENGSSDNCFVTDWELSQDVFDCDDAGQTITITLTVIDQSDNEGECTANVTVIEPTVEFVDPPSSVSVCANPFDFEITHESGGTPNNISDVMFSGPGITDADNGTFDPETAGKGTHEITVTALVNNCPVEASIMIEVDGVDLEILTSCICLNNSDLDTLDGLYRSYAVIRNIPSDATADPRVFFGTNLFNEDELPIPANTPFILCEGSGCPAGINDGDYYLPVFSINGMSFSITAIDGCSGELITSPTYECDNYPDLPDWPGIFSDTVLCVNASQSIPLGSGVFISGNPDFSLGPVDLPPGFSMDGNSFIIDFDDVLSTQEDFYLHRVSADMCVSSRNLLVDVIKAPELNFNHFSCIGEGDAIFLSNMLDGFVESQGIFSVNGEVVPNGEFSPDEEGCFTLNYDAGFCNFDPVEQDFLVTFRPQPLFEISFTNPNISNSPICQSGEEVEVILERQSQGNNRQLVVNSSDPMNNPTIEWNGEFATIQLPAPTTAGGITYSICLTEDGLTPMTACDSLPGSNFQPCQSTTCISILIYNDGAECGESLQFPSQCPLEEAPELCPVSTNPTLSLSCRWLTFSLPTDIVVASLSPESDLYFCKDEEVCVFYTLNLPGIFGDAVAAGPTVGSLPGMNVICSILNWRLRIRVFRRTLIDIRPFGSLGDGCNRTIGQLVLDGISFLAGGDGGGGYVAADTRGIGVFDVVEEIDFGVNDESFCFPNRRNETGYINVKVVGGWPFSASSFCGGIVSESLDLLDIIPIGSIPIVGPIVEDILKIAGCNVDIAFSAEANVQIAILDNTVPEFQNCPEDDYIFYTFQGCDAVANWSIPLAFSGCNGEDLVFSSDNPPILNPGIYQTFGPSPGEELGLGLYPVTYIAVGCNGNPSVCEFNVIVTDEMPTLVVPNDMTFRTDAGTCDRVVNGLAAIRGIGCHTTINYSYTNPVSGDIVSTDDTEIGIHNFPDGNIFEKGTTVITYTLIADITGDGNIDVTLEESFSITIVDRQAPVVNCIDVEIQLDNQGQGTVFAEDNGDNIFLNGGTTDNCPEDLSILISRTGQVFTESVDFDCTDVGDNLVTLRAIDADGNSSDCISRVNVRSFFDDIIVRLNIPPVCLGPFQDSFDLAPYVNIDLPNGTSIGHHELETLGSDVIGHFGILSFVPDEGMPYEEGVISNEGIFYPSASNGFLRIGYFLFIDGQVDTSIIAIEGCFKLNSQVIRVETYDPEWTGGDICCDAGPVWLGGASNEIPEGMISLEDIGGSYPEDTGGSWFGEGVSFVDPDGIPFSGDEYFQFDPDGLDGEYTLTYSVGLEACTFNSSNSIRVTCQPLLVGISDFTVCPANIVDEIEILTNLDDRDIEITTIGIAAVGGVDLVNEPVVNGRAVIEAFSSVAVSNQEFPITIFANQTNAFGCSDTIEFVITVLDEEAPVFLNCPRPNIVYDAQTDFCEAFVNFSLPLIADNCDPNPVLEKIDETGLTSGDKFPVGLTTLIWTATDTVGNVDTCEIKILVQDLQPPDLFCPQDIVTEMNDIGDCGAEVDGLTVFFDDNCIDNTALVYYVYNEEGDLEFRGFGDASGEFFPVGLNTLEYIVYDQPVVLITEIIQDGEVSGIEIGNFGPAVVDISCATLKRISGSDEEEHMIPNLTFLDVGEVYTWEFENIPAGQEATYQFEFLGRLIDEFTINDGLFDGDQFIRISGLKISQEMDFQLVTDCFEGSFGEWNPQLETAIPNNGQTSLQLEGANVATCQILVNVLDVEAPVCSQHDSLYYEFGSLPIEAESCNEISVINVPSGTVGEIRIFDLDITIEDVSQLSVSLISPSGTEVILIDNLCPMQSDVLISLDDFADDLILDAPCGPLGNGFTYQPLEPFKTFYREESGGDWILQLYTLDGSSGTVNSWELEILLLEDYDQPDILVENDEDECGAVVTWNHPVFDDNCCEGTMIVIYEFDNQVTGESYTITQVILDPAQSIKLDGRAVSRFYDVGITTVTYILEDQFGNTNTCGFTVEVIDAEPPEFPFGCPDQVVNLAPGECYGSLPFIPLVTDNCEIESIEFFFAVDGSPVDIFFVPIGVHIIWMVATDIYGNADTCEFVFEVIEFIPTSDVLICNTGLNVSLGPDCNAELNADMILEGGPYRCYENYCIEVTDLDGNPRDNYFDLNDVGQSFIVSVVDCLGGGNSCWGIVNIEEKLLPEIECPADTTLTCNEDLSDLTIAGNFELLSCAPNATSSYSDEYIFNQSCGDTVKIINRTFQVTSQQNRSSFCTQQIVVVGFNFDHVDFPQDITYLDPLSCSDVAENPDLLLPEYTGFPTIRGENIIGNVGECKINVGYWDEILQDASCPSGFEILRHWAVRNECLPLISGINPLRHIQGIKVEDNEPPVLLPFDRLLVSTQATACVGEPFTLPEVVEFDNCSDYEVVWSVAPYGLIQDDQVFGLQLGVSILTGRAIDACGNQSVIQIEVEVVDDIVPIALCDLTTRVSLGHDGLAIVGVDAWDDGSYDNCGIMDITARRKVDTLACGNSGNWEESIIFCCEDARINGIGVVEVELRVRDHAGNANFCWVLVEVEDKLRPQLTCPQDVTVNCAFDLDLDNLEVFGRIAQPQIGEDVRVLTIDPVDLSVPAQIPVQTISDGVVVDNCGIESITETNVLTLNPHCGNFGTDPNPLFPFRAIQRRFVVVDQFGNSANCQQDIYILNNTVPFNGNDIEWPRDITLMECGTSSDDFLPENLGAFGVPVRDRQPSWNTISCSKPAVTFSDQVFTLVDSACFKILRTWTVIDWCNHNPNTGQGEWSYVQVIYIQDTQAPVCNNCVDQVFIDTESSDCTGLAELVLDVSDCTPTDLLDVTWRIDAFKTGTYEISGIGLDATGNYPFGTHRIQWVVYDLCSNTAVFEYDFEVVDGKLPTPVCLHGVATVVMPASGCIELEAKLYNVGSFDNCTENEDLIFSWSADVEDQLREFCCEEDLGTNIVEIWVTDEAGNQDFCITYIQIQDPDGVCGSGSIAGFIQTEYMEPVEGVNLEMEWLDGNLDEYTTFSDGLYLFSNLESGNQYQIEAEKNDDPLNGVSTYDIVLIQRHILGIQQIESPYKLIAADVRPDGIINVLDIADLRSLILGKTGQFPNNSSWRFISADQVLQQGVTPDPNSLEMLKILDLGQTSIRDADFIGVKIGDLNNTVLPNNHRVSSERTSGEMLTFLLQEETYSSGDLVEVKVSVAEVSQISGFQFTFEFDEFKTEFVEFESGVMDINPANFGFHRTDEGLITASWNSFEEVKLSPDEVLFSFHFRMRADGRSSELFDLSDRITRSEAYKTDGQLLDLSLGFRDLDVFREGAVFALYQNQPNPFKGITSIGFILPDEMDAVIEIFDATGRLVKSIDGFYGAGYNEVQINQAILPASGIYYYQLKAQDYTATKKMIITEN